jgi:hypothetical protein
VKELTLLPSAVTRDAAGPHTREIEMKITLAVAMTVFAVALGMNRAAKLQRSFRW